MESEPTHKGLKPHPVLIGVGIIVLLVVGGIIWLASLPESGVKFANEMNNYALQYIEEHNLLNGTESLIAYYDVTISMDGSEAAILTTERVVYHKEGRATSIDLRDVDDVHHRQEEGVLGGDIIEISGKAGTRLKIEIAPLNLGESFYKALMDAWKLSREGKWRAGAYPCRGAPANPPTAGEGRSRPPCLI